MAVIPFYGAFDPEMFAIERAAMDKPGKVISRLDDLLPDGKVLDVGAGDGYTAIRLGSASRQIVGLEPATGMVRRDRPVVWVHGDGARLPFADDAFDAAYATWAFYFPQLVDLPGAIAELRRTVRGGPIVIVDNAGGDDFTAMSEHDIAAPLDVWRELGFEVELIETAFVFDTVADAERLLQFFFGDGARPALEVGFNVAVMIDRTAG